MALYHKKQCDVLLGLVLRDRDLPSVTYGGHRYLVRSSSLHDPSLVPHCDIKILDDDDDDD